MSKLPGFFLKQLLWTFLLSSISACFIQTIFFSIYVNKWFTTGDVFTLNILGIIFNLCLAITSLTTLFNLSIKVRNNKNYLVLSYFLFPCTFILMTLRGIFELSAKDISPLDFFTLYISYTIVVVVFFIFHIYFYIKFWRHLKTKNAG
jgi:hypothetical protein